MGGYVRLSKSHLDAQDEYVYFAKYGETHEVVQKKYALLDNACISISLAVVLDPKVDACSCIWSHSAANCYVYS